ncbi:hypothetical protein [Paenibacillus sp. PL2-23]
MPILMLLLVISIAANGYLLFDKQFNKRQIQEQNRTQLWSIAVSGDNIANHAETFLLHAGRERDAAAQEQLKESWRIMTGELSSIQFHLGTWRVHDMEEHSRQWSLLQVSLLRVGNALNGMTTKFLEQGYISLNDKEADQIQAAAEIYRRMAQEVQSEAAHPELVIEELTEPMLLLDPSYSYILDRYRKK